MAYFYQAYQFVPVKGLTQDPNSPKNMKEIKSRDATHSVRHDVWKKANSGKIICTLTLETPLVLGLAHKQLNGQLPNTLVLPEKRLFGEQEHYYIPANSLRGMISSIAEAITQSSLRVLENTSLKISMGKDKSKPLGKLHDYFESIDSNALPLGAPLRTNPRLTPAELIFGCIEDQRTSTRETAITLASRLRFSDAKLINSEDQPLMPEITLKALSTPKTNSHNMYYHPKNQRGEYIPKSELDSRDHQANGRKFYLHATPSMIENESWKVEGKPDKPDIHVKCQPLKAKQTFTFHINYENLSDHELGILLSSLRPDKNFHHKLGMGKPLGLGTVRLDIQGVFTINRLKRYARNAFAQSRYEKIFSDADSEQRTDWQYDYPLEKQELDSILAKQAIEPVAKHSALIDKDSFKILKRIGQYPYTEAEGQYEVDYPHVLNAKGEKQCGYAWFVKNDKSGGGQALKPINPDYSLPILETYQVE